MRRTALAMTRATLAAAFAMLSATVPVRAGDAAAPGQPALLIVQPDVVLWAVATEAPPELRPAWSDAARARILAALHERLAGTHSISDVAPPEAADPGSPLVQSLRLGDAVAQAIAMHGKRFGVYARRTDPPGGPHAPDWNLGPGISGLASSGGARFALLVHVHDGYDPYGRAAERSQDAVAGGDGLAPLDVAMLVDLRSGRVVWSRRLDRSEGDVRAAEGARATVAALLSDVPP